jgi:hypothetical protein
MENSRQKAARNISKDGWWHTIGSIFKICISLDSDLLTIFLKM